MNRPTTTITIGPNTFVDLDDLSWLNNTIGGDYLDQAMSDTRNDVDLSRRWWHARDSPHAQAAKVMRGALQAAARTEWRPLHAQMGQGTPLGNLVTDAVIRRIGAVSCARIRAYGSTQWRRRSHGRGRLQGWQKKL